MLPVSPAACSGYDIVEIMEKKRCPRTFFEAVVDGQRNPRPPWAYHTIQILYRLRGPGLTEKAVSRAIALSIKKYCPVAATIGGGTQIETAFEILAGEG
jgi:putative redox protein